MGEVPVGLGGALVFGPRLGLGTAGAAGAVQQPQGRAGAQLSLSPRLQIPVPVLQISATQHPVKAGLSDAFMILNPSPDVPGEPCCPRSQGEGAGKQLVPWECLWHHSWAQGEEIFGCSKAWVCGGSKEA